MLVRDTGIEPVTSSVSGKRSPAELIARDRSRRWRRESNPCARLCRPLPHHSATPPLGLMPLHLLRADDGIRTRDPHLGKVMRYQLRYIRGPRTTRRPSRRTTIVHQSVAAQISTILAPGEVRTADTPAVKSRTGSGSQISARDARRGTFAPQEPGGNRLAIRQHLVRAEGGVARADK